MANTEIDPFAYNPAAAASIFGELPPQAAPKEVDTSQYLPQAQSMQGRSSSYDEAFQQAESQYGLPSGLLSTIGFHESRFNPEAESPAGAKGLMQFMPATANEYGINARDPYASIDAAGKKMSGLVKYYNGDMAKAVAAYNYGEGNLNKAIRKAGDNWISAVPRETQFYVSKVLGGQPQGQEAQGPQEDTYPIPLASGRTLYAPKGMPREEALASARAQGVDAIGLRDIPLASGKTLQVPEHLTDEEAIKQASEAHPDIDFALAKKETPSRTTGQAIQDIGVGTMKGGLGLGQSLVGLVDILTPGQFGKSLEEHGINLEKAQQYLDTQYSPQQQEAINNLAQAHGFRNILQAAVENPTAVISMAGESLPQVIGGGVVGAGAKLAGLGRFAAAGLGQGSMTAGSTGETVRTATPERELTTKGQVAALGAGAVEAALGKYGSEFVTKIGGIDPSLLIMGEAKKLAVDTVGEVAENPKFFTTVLKSLVGEGVEEIPQEAQAQMFQNYATDKPLLEGVEDAATKGLITGAVTGAGAGTVGALSAQPTPEITPEVKVPPEGEEEEAPKFEITPEIAGYVAQAEAVKKGAKQAPAAEEVVTGAPAVEEVVAEPTVKAKKEKPVKTEPTWLTETLGLPESSAVYKRIASQGLDINNPEQHDAIDRALAPLSTNKKISGDQWSVLDQRMEAVKQGQPIPTPEIQNAQQIPSPSPIVRDGGTQPQEGQAVKNIPQVGKGVEPSRQGELIAQKGAEEKEVGKVGKVGKVEEAPREHVVWRTPDANDKTFTYNHPKTALDLGNYTYVFDTTKGNSYSVNDRDIHIYKRGEKRGGFSSKADLGTSGHTYIRSPKLDARSTLTETHIDENTPWPSDVPLTLRKALIQHAGAKTTEQIKASEKNLLTVVNQLEEDNRAEQVVLPQGIKVPKVQVPEVKAGKLLPSEIEAKRVADLETLRLKKQAEREEAQARGVPLETEREAGEPRQGDINAIVGKAAKPVPTIEDLNAKVTAAAEAARIKEEKAKFERETLSELADQGEQDYFSVAETAEPTGHTAESLTKTLSPEMKRLVDSGKAVIHDTAETLPEGDHPENVQGLTTPEGVAHFVADKLTPESIQNVALHEVGTHVGMENLVGPEVYKDITHQALNNVGPAFDRARASIPKDTPAHLRHHEALAYLVQHAPHLSVVKKLISAIRNFARTKLGIKVKLTEADAKHLALKALRKESMTAKRTAHKEGTAYSLKTPSKAAKDKDMGIDDIMSEVRADLEAGRDSATAKATEELKYESLSSQEAVVSKAIDRTIKKEKAEELKVFDIPEKKIQLFAARKKAHALLEAGKISQEDFIRRSEQITDEERVRHAEAAFKRNPRARGADYVREKLLNALRKGDVSQEEHDFAEWFIKKNPNALENLGISIKASPEGKKETAGNYTPLNQVVTLFKGHNKDTTAVHEILHHLERAMPEQIQKGIRRAWLKQTVDAREKAIKNKADKSVINYYDAVLLGEPKAARDALMKVKEGRDEIYQHLNASEFWAVNATDIMQGKYGADASFIAKAKQWLKEAYEHIKHVLGLNSNAPVLKAIDHVLKNIATDYTSKKMLAERTKGIIYAAPPSGPSKAAKDLGKTIVDEGLVKTSDKKPIDSVKEGFELAKKHGTLTKLATGWIDSSRGLSRALSELDSMDVKGEMRADLIHSKLQQIYNLVRECFSEGYLVLSGDGGLMTKLDKSLALEHIFKRIDALGYPDSRKTFFSVMRVLAGESNLRHDAEQRALAKRYTDYIRVRQKDVENLEGGIVDAKRAKNKVAVAQLQKDLRELNSKLSAFKAEAKRIYDRVGKKSLVDIEADIARKEAVAKKKEALAAATADATMKDKLNKEASDLRDSIERLSSKIEGTGVGTEKRVTQEQIDIVKELLANDDRLEPIMADIHTALRKSVDLWEETGLIDADTADNWRDNPAYIPLYKSMDDKETDDMLNDPSKYVQMLMVGAKSEAKVHAREGGLHDVNVGENLVKHFAFMAGAAAQNQYRKIAAKHLEVVGVAKEIPTKINGKEVTPDDPQAVMFKEDGKKVYYHVSDPVAFEAFQTMIPVLGSFSKAAQHYTKFFRTATLVNPVYWYRQLIREPFHANLVSRTGIITPLHAMKAFAEILTDRSGTYKTLKRHGVVGAVDSISDPKQFVKAVALERGVVRKSADWVMRVHEAADAATRVAIFDKAIEEATKKGITGQHAENFAAMRAREIINFSKKGNARQIAAIRATVPFFSSQLNGMDTLARAAFPGKYGNLNKVEAAEAKKHFYANAAMLVTASMAFALVMQDDEEYQKSSDWVDNWLIPTGDKENPFWKIPIPFEAGFLFKVIPEAIIRMLSGTLTYNQGMKSITDAGNRLLIPALPIPQILKPIAEVVANHDYHTGNPIENYSESRLPKEQRTAHASELSKLLGEALPISPDNIEHLGRGWATGAWAMSAALADAFLNKGVLAPEKAWSETYLGKGVLSKGHTDRALSEFYSAATGASQIHNAVMAANKMGDRDTVDAIKNDPDKLKQFKASSALQDIGTSISAMQHNIKRIKAMKDTEVSPAEKAKRIRVVQDRINNLAQKALVVGKRFDLDI